MTGLYPKRVLLIGGWGRCGSTVLDMLLGQVPGMFSAGEVRELWLRGCVENRPCGCGNAFLDCPFWTRVGKEAFGAWESLHLDDLIATRYSVDRLWGIPELLIPQLRPQRADALSRYRAALSRLYGAIANVSGARVVIDSSKIPSHAFVLRGIDDVDVRMVHLVRDSRGVAYSCQKRVEKRVSVGPPTYLPQHGPLGASARYVAYNGLSAALRATEIPYLLLRYEDLIIDPAAHLRDVLMHAGERGDVDLPFLDRGHATLAENHLVDGNPVRFTKGGLTLRSDEAWRSQMSKKDRLLVTALTMPMLTAYGYRVHLAG